MDRSGFLKIEISLSHKNADRIGLRNLRTRIASFYLALCTVGCLSLILSTSEAAVSQVIVTIDPELYPVQNTSGGVVPDGTALFVVSYKTTQEDFFTALRGASSAADLIAVFSNQLKFFNSDPFLKGDYGTYENSAIGWDSGGGAIAEVTTTTTSNLPIFVLFSSNQNPLNSTASFLLVKSVSTSDYIPTSEEILPTIVIRPRFVDRGIVVGSDVIFGQYFSSTGAFQMAAAGAYGQITSATTMTINAGSTGTYQILTNNGANTYALTSTPPSLGASIDPATGLITLSPGASIIGPFTLTFTAYNSVTGKTAIGSLTVTVQVPTGPSFTSSATTTATAGVALSYPITTDAPSIFTATTPLPSGLNLDSATGVLSGIPRSATTSTITIRAARTINAASFTDQNLTLTVSLPTLEISALVSGILTRTAGTAHTIPVTIPAGFTVDSYTFEPEISGVTYRDGNLVISSAAAPLAKAKLPEDKTSEAVKMILKRTSGLDGSIISVSLDFKIRLVAPTPSRLTTAEPFQVAVGESYGLQLATDVSAICPNQKIEIEGILPDGLINSSSGERKTGRIEGTNKSTTLPWEFKVTVVADTSTEYEGGGILREPNVRFQLYNPAPPVINSSTRTKLAGVGKACSQYSITASGAPFQFTATDLPPGLALVGANINGTPTSAGIKTVRLKAYNYFRPGLPSSGLQIGDAYFQIYVSGAKPTKTVSVFGANDLRVGTAASLSAGEGYRVNGYGLPPGLIFDKATGLITGTPTVAGTFTATLFIQNALGWISKTVTLRVQ